MHTWRSMIRCCVMTAMKRDSQTQNQAEKANLLWWARKNYYTAADESEASDRVRKSSTKGSKCPYKFQSPQWTVQHSHGQWACPYLSGLLSCQPVLEHETVPTALFPTLLGFPISIYPRIFLKCHLFQEPWWWLLLSPPLTLPSLCSLLTSNITLCSNDTHLSSPLDSEPKTIFGT